MRKGQKMPEELRERLIGNTHGAGNRGRKFEDSTLQKMSLAKKGRPSPRKGMKLSLETREKISQAKRSSILFIPDTDDRKRIRRERIKVFGGSHSKAEWENLKSVYNFNCAACKKNENEVNLTRDHIVSISCGGSDNIENIQPLCNPCNAKKGTATIRY